MAIGAKQSAGWWGPLALPAIVGYSLLLWVSPPLVVLWSVVTGLAGGRGMGRLPAWSLIVSRAGLGIWAIVYPHFQVSPAYALMYPVGGALVSAIALRSGWWGSRYSSGEVGDDSV